LDHRNSISESREILNYGEICEDLIIFVVARRDYARYGKVRHFIGVTQFEIASRSESELPCDIFPDEAIGDVISRQYGLALNLPPRSDCRRPVEPSAGKNDGLIRSRSRNDVQEGRGDRALRLQPLDDSFGRRFAHQSLITCALAGKDHVCTERAKFLSQFLPDVDLHVEHSGNHGTAAHYGHEGDCKPASIAAKELPQ
jgi:hypothetical protein